MWTTIFLGIILSVFSTESRLVPVNYATVSTLDDPDSMIEANTYDIPYRSNFKSVENRDSENSYDVKKKIGANIKTPCAIVVLSNVQNPNMHSLLRKYRYDANGVLIPSSVKYFVKIPQGERSSTVLVPLHDRAFSPLGGFVRYYKEVPPIPQSW